MATYKPASPTFVVACVAFLSSPTVISENFAVALAAIAGRKRTNDDDILLASEYTLNHRRTVFETEEKKTSLFGRLFRKRK